MAPCMELKRHVHACFPLFLLLIIPASAQTMKWMMTAIALKMGCFGLAFGAAPADFDIPPRKWPICASSMQNFRSIIMLTRTFVAKTGYGFDDRHKMPMRHSTHHATFNATLSTPQYVSHFVSTLISGSISFLLPLTQHIIRNRPLIVLVNHSSPFDSNVLFSLPLSPT